MSVGTTMKEARLDAALAEIDNRYYYDDENPEPALEALSHYYRDVWGDAAAERAFARKAAAVAGGIFIPHLFWAALNRFLKDPDERTALAELFEAFGNSNFDEETQKFLRPLAVVYFLHEKEFEVDRLRTRVLSKMHPGVRDFIEQLVSFGSKNHNSALAFDRKFKLVGALFPDFDIFNQPLSHLEEQLG